jgi:hypothetical protein
MTAPALDDELRAIGAMTDLAALIELAQQRGQCGTVVSSYHLALQIIHAAWRLDTLGPEPEVLDALARALGVDD